MFDAYSVSKHRSRYLQHKRDTLGRHADVHAGFTTPAFSFAYIVLFVYFFCDERSFASCYPNLLWLTDSLHETFFRYNMNEFIINKEINEDINERLAKMYLTRN